MSLARQLSIEHDGTRLVRIVPMRPKNTGGNRLDRNAEERNRSGRGKSAGWPPRNGTIFEIITDLATLPLINYREDDHGRRKEPRNDFSANCFSTSPDVKVLRHGCTRKSSRCLSEDRLGKKARRYGNEPRRETLLLVPFFLSSPHSNGDVRV